MPNVGSKLGTLGVLPQLPPVSPFQDKYKFQHPVSEYFKAEMVYFKDSVALKYILSDKMFETTVISVAEGMIIHVDDDIVSIDHGDGYISMYEGMYRLNKHRTMVGEAVLSKHAIGWAQNELLFYLIHNGTYIVPDAWLKGNRLSDGHEKFTDVQIDIKKMIILEEMAFIRQTPNALSTSRGFLRQGDVIDVLGFIIDGQNLWVRIGHEQFVCIMSGNIRYTEWYEE